MLRGIVLSLTQSTRTHTTGLDYAAKHRPHTQNKHIWTIISNFSLQVITPWWWILCDPKHVGV